MSEPERCLACGARRDDPDHDCGGCATCGALNRGYGADGDQCADCLEDDDPIPAGRAALLDSIAKATAVPPGTMASMDGTTSDVARFIPHGATCEADDGRGSDFGRCGSAGYGYAVHEGRERVVCQFHFDNYAGPRIRGTHS